MTLKPQPPAPSPHTSGEPHQEVVYVRTAKGQYFYDVVMSQKSPKYLARKWRRRIADIRFERECGLAIMYGTPSQRRKANVMLTAKIVEHKQRERQIKKRAT